MFDKKKNTRNLVKYSLISFVIGVYPLFYIFILYIINPESPVIYYLFKISDGYARAFSEEYLTYTTISSAYTKTGPAFSIVMYLLCWRKFNLIVFGIDLKKALKILPKMVFFIFIGYYLMYAGELNLTTYGGWKLGFLSDNLLFLFIFYILCFLTNYYLIWIGLFYLYILVKSVHPSKMNNEKNKN